MGVRGRTGTRWRLGCTAISSSGSAPHYQPATTTTAPGLSAKYLSPDERIVIDKVLREKVQGWLDLRWSPGQIAKTLRLEFPDNPARHLVHESIHQAIYARGATLGRESFTFLRTRHRLRRTHRHPDARRAGATWETTMIGGRPANVADWAVAAHGDLQRRGPPAQRLVCQPPDGARGAAQMGGVRIAPDPSRTLVQYQEF